MEALSGSRVLIAAPFGTHSVGCSFFHLYYGSNADTEHHEVNHSNINTNLFTCVRPEYRGQVRTSTKSTPCEYPAYPM
jgi:hypothetical protein